jgi:hypothetical protein
MFFLPESDEFGDLVCSTTSPTRRVRGLFRVSLNSLMPAPVLQIGPAGEGPVPPAGK